MIYIICFIISGIFFFISERMYNNKNIFNSKLFAFLGIIIISLLAGARANSIGKDVGTYVVYAFERIKNYSSIIQVFQNYKLEIGYELLIYLCTRVVKDIHFLHFITSLIITSGFYSFVRQFAKNNKYAIYYGMITYMFLYFNTSLNIVRQFIALSIFLFGIKFLFQDKYLKYLLFIIVATLFHKSAIIGVAVLILYKLLNTKQSKPYMIFISIVLTCLGLVFLDNITAQLLNVGLFSSKYMNYFSGTGNSSIFMQIVSRIPILILGLLFYKRLIKHDMKNQMIYSFLIIDCLLGCMSVVIGDASRLSLYFGVWQCLFVPELILIMKEFVDKNGRFFVALFMHLYLFSYWGYCFVFRNFANTYPYISDLFHN